MNRGFLMVLLALDILVMGASAYVLWERTQKVQETKAVSAPAATPVAAPTPQKPTGPSQDTPAPSSTPPAAKPPVPQKSQKPTPKKMPSQSARKVHFQYRDSVPKNVAVIGDFNQWSLQLMKKDEKNRWNIVLRIKPGTYAYNFLVDGKMIRDPSNRKMIKAGQKIPSSVLVVR